MLSSHNLWNLFPDLSDPFWSFHWLVVFQLISFLSRLIKPFSNSFLLLQKSRISRGNWEEIIDALRWFDKCIYSFNWIHKTQCRTIHGTHTTAIAQSADLLSYTQGERPHFSLGIIFVYGRTLTGIDTVRPREQARLPRIGVSISGCAVKSILLATHIHLLAWSF